MNKLSNPKNYKQEDNTNYTNKNAMKNQINDIVYQIILSKNE